MEKECASLVEKCKAEAKQLVEVTATKKKIHWSHPSFTSFCVSVEDILSYQVKRRYRGNKATTSSSRILRELGKSYPPASEVFNKCFSGSKEGKEEYSFVQSGSVAERRVLWIRVALLEGKLTSIVEKFVNNPRAYYEDKSVLCHPVYGQVFQSLIDGPCSIRFSRVKFTDGGANSLSPSELVNRHKKVLSLSASKDETAMPTEKAWDHVQSLYQSNAATCLFGKNNILVKLAGQATPLRGYLTLQKSFSDELQLKWIPNCLLNDSSHVRSGLWNDVIAVDVVKEIAHIHCHRAKGCSAEMILIGYDGIAHLPFLFPHQPSLFMFLECLENSLLPEGCLEPPLWYLKQSSKSKNMRSHTAACASDEEEWFHNLEAWNQVFRIRYGGTTDMSIPSPSKKAPPTNSFPLFLAPYSSVVEESSSDNDDEEEGVVSMETSTMANWESFQAEVSKQLLARNFYSWLSYCRHMTKVRQSVAHLVSHTHIIHIDKDIDEGSPLSETEWLNFCELPPSEREEKWEQLLQIVYLRGVEHSIRAQVWPFLLGVFPVTSTASERESILSDIAHSYQQLMSEWRRSEVTHRELERAEGSSRESSPALSSISPSPPTLSPLHHDNKDNIPIPDLETVTPTSVTPTPPVMETATPTSVTPTLPVICEDLILLEKLGVENGLSSELDHVIANNIPPMSCDYLKPRAQLDERGSQFIEELFNIDKDIPRCDRDYWYFKSPGNLLKVRNIVCTYVWGHLSEGYSQGMCDLLAPILVATNNEPLAYACYLKLMERSSKLFPPNPTMNTLLANLQALLQVMEPEYHHYLTERPTGDGLFYCYRWLLVSFKREFSYDDLFRLWESTWAARLTVSEHFEEFLALAVMKQFKSAIMDAHLDPSDILNLFTDLADKHRIDSKDALRRAILTVHKLQEDLAVK